MTTREEELEDFNNYEQDIVDTDDIAGADIKINPDYYIHNALIKSQSALVNPNVQEGFLQFRVLVENLEMLARASNRLPKTYEEKIAEFIKTDPQYTHEANAYVKAVILANKKQELLLTQIFASKTATSIMKA